MSSTVLVGNLPVDTTEEKLLDWMRESGFEIQVTVLLNEDGNCIGFARLEVASEEEAEKLISEYDRERFYSRVVYMNKEAKVAPPENWISKMMAFLFPHRKKPQS